MKVKYKVTEIPGTSGRQLFVVQIGVEFSSQEHELSTKYDVDRFIKVDERFNKFSGVGPLGHLEFDSLRNGLEMKVATIQLAFNFVAAVLDGLRRKKTEFEVTRDNVENLAEELEIVID